MTELTSRCEGDGRPAKASDPGVAFKPFALSDPGVLGDLLAARSGDAPSDSIRNKSARVNPDIPSAPMRSKLRQPPSYPAIHPLLSDMAVLSFARDEWLSCWRASLAMIRRLRATRGPGFAVFLTARKWEYPLALLSVTAIFDSPMVFGRSGGRVSGTFAIRR
jgi:hypothetical protein